ncbi:hypothetical protein [Burkholderia plantarii]|uniref:hypothetical protein n=1 Tax=Burkholderia plantarii TaxID=41899 RepID=UPI00114D0455|nr:hypothetical protein [Burkholderia plantarii]
MSESKQQWTPGPWEVDATGYRAKGDGVCVMAWPRCVAVIGAFNPDMPNDANAKLIAAAPDLVEALRIAEKKLVELEGQVGGGDDEIYVEGAILTIRAALAKAGA